MENNNTYYVDLISRYLAGEASEDDKVFLEKWLEAGEENRKIFREYQRTWNEIEESKIEDAIDLDAEWKKLNERIERENPSVIPMRSGRTRTLTYVLAMAAMIVLIAVPVYFLVFFNRMPASQKLEARMEVTNGILPDGSSVTLNRGAILEYPSKFRKGPRQVQLTGEAYFEVKHDEKKPFIITSGNVKVEVLGTSFYVNTCQSLGQMEVILNSGKVKVYFSDDAEHGLILSPGEKADVSCDNHSLKMEVNTDENYLSWKTGRLVFSNTPLPEIIRILEKDYHAHIELANPELTHCLVTATFENQSLEAVINVLKATLNLKVSVSGQTIILTGGICK